MKLLITVNEEDAGHINAAGKEDMEYFLSKIMPSISLENRKNEASGLLFDAVAKDWKS